MTAATPFETNFLNRLQIERRYNLTADADEADAALPDEQRWLEALDSTEDGERFVELLDQFEDKPDQHLSKIGPVGGDCERPQVRYGDGELYPADLAIEPPLLEFKPYVSRILVKNNLLTRKIMLLIDASRMDHSLSQERILEVGRSLQLRELLDWEDDGNEEAGSKDKKPSGKATPVHFQVVVVGAGALSDGNRQFLKGLKKQFSPKDRIFIAGFILDTASQGVWTTSPWLYGADCRYFRHALTHPDQSAEQIREHLESQRVRPSLVALGFVATVVLFLAGFQLCVLLDLTGTPVARFALDIGAPLLGSVIGLTYNRLRVHCARQLLYTLIAWLALYWGVMLYVLWIPGFQVLVYLASVSAFTWYITQLMGITAEMD